MRRVGYCVAMSLDGYIAGPADESDWILTDPKLSPKRILVARLSALCFQLRVIGLTKHSHFAKIEPANRLAIMNYHVETEACAPATT